MFAHSVYEIQKFLNGENHYKNMKNAIRVISACLALLALANVVVGECDSGGVFGQTLSFIVPQSFFDDGLQRYQALIEEELKVLKDEPIADLNWNQDQCNHGVCICPLCCVRLSCLKL